MKVDKILVVVIAIFITSTVGEIEKDQVKISKEWFKKWLPELQQCLEHSTGKI